MCRSVHMSDKESPLKDELRLSLKLDHHHFVQHWSIPSIADRINNISSCVYTYGAIWYLREVSCDAFEGIDNEMTMYITLRKVDVSWIRNNADKYLIGPINEDTKFDMTVYVEDRALYDIIQHARAYSSTEQIRLRQRRMVYAGGGMTVFDEYTH